MQHYSYCVGSHKQEKQRTLPYWVGGRQHRRLPSSRLCLVSWKMILSALLTSVGINLQLCLLFFTLYSILRKQPGNVSVYAPRLLQEHRSQQPQHSPRTVQFYLDRILPSAGWIRTAWNLSEDDLLALSGLDAVVFMRIFVFSLKVFIIATIAGILILLPINHLGTQLSDDLYDLLNKSLDSFSISNVDNGSNW